MTDIRYQVFVSSTFRDLAAERQAVLNAILQLDHFPVGMEAFPAADGTPWDLIEKMIEDSDYYVLIIAGRYGAVTANGVSYTEKEYDLARRLGKTVLAFLHESPDELAVKNVDMAKEARSKLQRFLKHVESSHLCKLWRDKDQLALFVTTSLLSATRLNPSPGWVRNKGPETTQLLSELND